MYIVKQNIRICTYIQRTDMHACIQGRDIHTYIQESYIHTYIQRKDTYTHMFREQIYEDKKTENCRETARIIEQKGKKTRNYQRKRDRNSVKLISLID